ncbi:MAG: ATP synthase subunit I, partial [Terracidiphilus sp.]
MSEETHPILGLTEEAVEALLKRAVRNVLILGLLSALVLLVAMGWRDAAMVVTGALISAASIWEWLRLVRLMNARMRKQKAQRGAVLVLFFFLLRLIFFAAVLYGSLKCFHGSPIALLFGLSF